MQIIFSRIQFFFLSLFVFLIPLQTVYIFRQGSIGQSGLAKEGIWQFGTLALYATDILFFLILISAVLRIVLLIRAREKRKKFLTEVFAQRKDPIFLSLLFLVCIAFFSIIWASDKILALQMALRLFEGVMIFFLLSRTSQGRRMALVWMLVVGAGVQSVFCIIQFFMQEVFAISWLGISHHAPWIPGDAVVENSERRWLRAYGSFPHPNILAAYLVAAYFFCVTLVMRSEKKIQTWIATCAGIVILFGLVLIFSREAWLGLIVGLGVMGIASCHTAILRGQPEGSRCFRIGFPAKPDPAPPGFASLRMTIFRRFVTTLKTLRISPLFFFFLISGATILFSSMLFSEPLAVRLGIGGWKRLEVKSMQERIGSVKEFLSLGPEIIRGVGIGQYTNTLYENDVKKNTVRPSYAYQPVHNVFFLVLAELGIVGFIAFIGFLFFLSRRSFQELCQSNYSHNYSTRWIPAFAGMTKIGFAILSSFIIISFFDHFFWTLHSGVLLWWICMAGLDKK